VLVAVAGVFAADPEGVPTADVVALVSGLDWLAGRRTPVINMSFAGEPNTVVALALRRAIAGHAVVVAAAGNGGATAAPAFPAAEAGVIAVTAVDSHAQPYAEANHGSYVAFAAPGVRLWTPGSTPASRSGVVRHSRSRRAARIRRWCAARPHSITRAWLGRRVISVCRGSGHRLGLLQAASLQHTKRRRAG
jgi:hypothetical protein